MANILKCVLICCIFLNSVLAKHEEYEGYTVYEVSVKDEEQATFVNQLEYQLPIDMWMPARPNRPGQFFVSKDYKQQFEMLLTATEVKYKSTITNIKEQLDKEEQLLAAAASKRSNRSSVGLDFNQIHRTAVVDAYLDRLANQYPNLVTVVTAGQSFEGRPIKYLKISTTNFEVSRKPVVFLQSLLHAREWVTLPATLYAIEKLVIDVTDSDVLEEVDWIIMPIANPDGYEFSHTNTRFWRKNRATGFMIGNFCMGVDLNRNFDIFWSTASSNNVCSDVFHGTSAFSEPETQAIRRVLHEYSDRIELYIDIHSFGSIILFGYGNGQLPPNALALNYVGVTMAEAIDKVKWNWKPNYVVGNVFHILYAASGGSSDYVQSIGVPLSYTFELPAFNNIQGQLNGFLVDPDFIEQAGYETWEGIKAGARLAADSARQKNAN
ncbi:unnamed protein product [Diatraea saccharalis]|uniref:Peptidase M14 domain-containing protein n=1 Tax=Diatraea saccharalis TaxID=40085 RepID=A0A9N9N1I5_9NEOP|nr:unnamed protein product [Diatraea saccharalis]